RTAPTKKQKRRRRVNRVMNQNIKNSKSEESMSKPLSGQKIAILVANGFDETDMTHAQRKLAALGATLKIVSTENGLVNSWVGTGWGHHFPTDGNVNTTLAADYDGVYVPGGKRSTDKLKENAHVKRILRGFFD